MYFIARLLLLASAGTLIAGLVGLVATFHPWSTILVVLYLLGRFVRRRSFFFWGHGTARWCSLQEMKRAGMFSGHGLILGRTGSDRPGFLRSAFRLLGIRNSKQACRDFLAAIRFARPDNQLVRMPPRVVHSVVFAPTGGGKGVSIVLPWLLTNPGSCVVIDFKAENFKLSGAARRRMGHKVVCLDPYGIVGGRDGLNPFDLIDPDSPTAIDDCRTIAEALVVRQGTEHEPYWNDSAELWIGLFIALVACDAEAGKRDLNSVSSIMADPGRLQKCIDLACNSDRWDGLLAKWGSQLKHPAEKERGSILSTANRNLAFLSSQAVSRSVSFSTFDPAELRTGKMTVYLVIPPDRIRTQSGLLRLWINVLMRSVVKQGLGEKKLVHFILDEAAALGKMDSLTELVDKYRGYGCRSTFIYQSQGQLAKCWPEDGGHTLLSNASAVYFAVNDYQTATEVSNRLGNQTVAVESGGSSSGSSYSRPDGGPTMTNVGTKGHNWGESSNWSQIARPLLRPEEVMQLSPRTAITFCPGMPPIATTLLRYYEERFNPGRIRRAFAAIRVLIASVLVFGLTVGLAFGLSSIEKPAPAMEPRVTPQPKQELRLFGEEGG